MFIWATENNQYEENLEGDQTLFIKLDIDAKGYTAHVSPPNGKASTTPGAIAPAPLCSDKANWSGQI